MVIKWQGEIKRVTDFNSDESNQNQMNSMNTKNTLARRTSLVLSFIGFGISVLFFSRNVTGNVVGSFSESGANWLGGIFFILAIIGTLVYIQKNKK
jgi:TM2 domain-containing membrane protein YozV